MATKNRRLVKKKARATPSLIVNTVLRRLGSIEDLVIEMRGVQDLHLKRLAALQRQVDSLLERVNPNEDVA